MKIGDIVYVQPYTHMPAGTGKIVKRKLVKKAVVAVDNECFATLHRRKTGNVRLWQSIFSYQGGDEK